MSDKKTSIPTWALVLASVVIPASTVIHGFFQLKLEEKTKTHEIRRNYLDRAISQDRTPREQAVVFEFLVATLDPTDQMYDWAKAERDRLKEFLDLKPKLLEERVKRSNLEEKLTEVEASLETERAELASRERELREQEGVQGRKLVELGKEKEAMEKKYLATISSLQSEIREATTRAEELDERLTIAREKVLPEKASVPSASAGGLDFRDHNTCCVTDCSGAVVCGPGVQTACGSCSVGDGSRGPFRRQF